MAWRCSAVLSGLALTLAGLTTAHADEWAYYGHDAGGGRFSPLTQVNRSNVAELKPAWTFHTGDIADGKDGPRSGFETTPLFLDGTLYLTTPFNRVIALDPTTGRQLWAYDPKLDIHTHFGDGLINRGVAAWRDGKAISGACAIRLFEATLDARLLSIDAKTGQGCKDFGQNGVVSLRDVERYTPGPYHMTSPPVVIDDLVIVGSAIDDNTRVDMPSGVVRAFDARTGVLRWSWQPLQPAPGQKSGAGNAWSVMAVDLKRHLVFVPTGSASPDYYGGLRVGDDKWADSLVALNSRTGKLVWGFQLVHHDLWDYDTATPPLLATIPHDGKPTPVVIVGNKTGFLYVLDRDTGRPVFPVEERPVPQSDVPGEQTSPTQPFSVGLPALSPQSIKPGGAFAISPPDKAACEAMLAKASGLSLFTPPSVQGMLAMPGNVGGMNWSGFSFDPGRNTLIVNTNNLPYWVRLIPQDDVAAAAKGDMRAEVSRQRGGPYGMSRAPFLSPTGVPCVPPPWGELIAVDLAKGAIRWRTPLGVMSELNPAFGQFKSSGSLSLGGSIATAGGLAFIGGTLDRTVRAFDVDTGKELWSTVLPASAHATPMTFEAGGKR
jgi:quinoprotein glucose dehydrogenase